MIKRKKMISLLLVLTLVSGMFVQTYATEIDDTKKKAEELESKKKAAENEKNTQCVVRKFVCSANTS